MLVACAQQPTQPQYTPKPRAKPELEDAHTRAEIHTQLGAAYFEIGNLAVALVELNEALQADPDYGKAYNVRGLVYMQLGEADQAEQSFQRALNLSPEDSDANNNYGWFLCRQNRHEEGIRHIMTALKNPLYSTPDKSYVNAGMCARDRGDNKSAAEFFERALLSQPRQLQALYQLADMAYRANQLPAAKGYLQRLTQTGATFNAEALWLALRIERRLGDKDAEASYGLRLRRNFPDSRETQALLNGQFE
jgi:type IV pilus assembly protein PilF